MCKAHSLLPLFFNSYFKILLQQRTFTEHVISKCVLCFLFFLPWFCFYDSFVSRSSCLVLIGHTVSVLSNIIVNNSSSCLIPQSIVMCHHTSLRKCSLYSKVMDELSKVGFCCLCNYFAFVILHFCFKGTSSVLNFI